tara:strand:- start:414 stop:761 length:348 start_codon:yes stop_codon:yes gene_type:complete
MITYTWKITALKKAPYLNGMENVITNIQFKYTGTDEDGISAHFSGACPISAPSEETFTEMANVTEADVVLWAQANHEVKHMQEIIIKAINDKVTPMSENVDDVDWLNSEEETPAE